MKTLLICVAIILFCVYALGMPYWMPVSVLILADICDLLKPWDRTP